MSPNVREQVAHLCAIVASTKDEYGPPIMVYDYAVGVGLSEHVADLATEASLSVRMKYDDSYSWREPWAEAEAMLRCGEFP